MLPPVPGSTNCDSGVRFFHQPAPQSDATRSTLDIADYEQLLSDWFGAEVVLLSSGRAGIALYFQALGLDRYRSSVELPRFISPCVMDTVVEYAYPTERGDGDAVTILYHQYGYPQVTRPQGRILEDICHRFYERPSSGRRRWVGQASVFSLPKFFGTAGMAGGIVTADAALANTMRELRRRCPAAPRETRQWMRAICQKVRSDPDVKDVRPYLRAAYALLWEYVQPDLDDLAGFPTTGEGIRAIGESRAERIDRLIEGLGANASPADFIDGARSWLPFAFAYFGSSDPGRLAKADQALREAGIRAGIYRVDVARNATAPDYRPCLLLPCHQDVPEARLDDMVRIVRRHDG